MGSFTNMSEALQQLTGSGVNSYLTGAVLMGFSAAGIVIGLLICFFGVKIMRLLAAVLGLVVGAAAGALVGTLLNVDSTPMVIIVVVAAIIGAALLIFLRRLASFVMVFIYALSICTLLLGLQKNVIITIICVVIPLILAILAAVFVDPFIIVFTGLGGGISVGTSLVSLVKIDNSLVGYGLGLVIAILGIVAQFIMYSKKQSKRDKQKAKLFWDKDSRESEVERARHLLGDDGYADDDADDDDDITFLEYDDDDDLDYLDDDDDYLDD